MNFDGYAAAEVSRFSSLVEQDSADNLPLGVSPFVRNTEFHLTGARTRSGIQNRWGFTLPDSGAVTGLAGLKMGGPSGDLQVPIAFSALGHLYKEVPVGSGRVQQITGPLVTLPANSSMQSASAFTKGFLAFGDLVNSTARPAVYNIALGTLDPLSMRPVGDPWAPATQYQVGEIVTPSTPVGGTGHTFRCTRAGTSGGVQPPEFTTLGGGNVSELAGTGAQSGSGVSWTDPNDVTMDDGASYAVVATSNGSPSKPLLASTFGFAIPGGATIVGIKVTGVAFQTGATGPSPSAINMEITGGTNPGTNRSFIPTLNVATPFALGGPTDLWGDVNPTPTQANDAGFGPTITAIGGNPNTTSLQNVAVTIYYVINPGATITDGTVVWNELTPVMSSSTVAGNIAQGLRYMVVLYVNRNGYISGMSQASVITTTIGDSVHQLEVDNIETGPENTVARILAFTPAGQLGQLAGNGISSAGPYFWISPAAQFFGPGFNLTNVPGGITVADVVNGVTMNSTLINDNTTTSATFNFTDDYLKATLNDVSSYFRKIQVPPCSDVWYSQTLQRNFYAADNLPSGWYVSLLADPESVFGDKGLIQVAENNGENRTAIREFAGIIYPMKEGSGHVLTPSPDDPSTWSIVQQWTGSGPCGPRAVDVCTNFMCYVHQSGVYIFQSGQPVRISKEIPITWSQINWKYKQTIWVMIDDQTQVIRIGVPYGQSTVPSIVLTLNYEESPTFQPPIHFSPYIGKEIATGESYKWSIDSISANLAIRAQRNLVNPPATIDSATTQSQILYASSNSDGHVDPIIPGIYDDNGIGIDWVIETACPQALMKPVRLGGVQANVDGYGQLQVEVLALRAKDQKQGGVPTQGGKPEANAGRVLRLKKPIQAGVPYSCGGSMTNERIRVRISNNKQPGVFGDVKWVAIYTQPIATARPG